MATGEFGEPEVPRMKSQSAATLPGIPGVAVEPSRRMRGKGFKWEHEIQIALPASYYKSDRAYPVLWVTDGSHWFDSAVRIVNLYAQRYTPEMIVVGVGTPADALSEHQMRRHYEFTPTDVNGFEGFGSKLLRREEKIQKERKKALGIPAAQERGGASHFLAFLVDTLRPVLARDYRMMGPHVLFGDSLGGLFCAYALLTRPGAFAKYICGSPYLYASDFELFRMEERYSQTHADLSAEVFFGAGEDEILEGGLISAVGIVSSMTRMAEILKLRSYPSLKLRARIFPGEGHESVIPVNLMWGLRTLWEDETKRNVPDPSRAKARRGTAAVLLGARDHADE